MSSGLSSLLDPQKFNDGNVSPQIKNFYKKLIETDAQIKILKKGLYSPTQNSNKDSMYRLKRSLFRSKTAKAHAAKSQAKPNATKDGMFYKAEKKNKGENQKENNKKTNTKANQKPSKKVKRFENGSLIPEGYIYRKKQILIKYLQSPGNKPKFPKCSHVQKNEDKQNHLHNENSEQLNQLLSNFLDIKENIQTSVSGVTPTLSPPATGTSSTAESSKTTFVDTETMLTESASPDFTEETNHRSFYVPQVMAKKMKLWYPWSSAVKPNNQLDSQISDGMYSDLKDIKKKDDRDMDYVAIPQYDFVTSPKYLFQKGGKWKKSINKNKLSDENDRVYESDKMSKVPSRKLQQLDEQEEDEEGLGYEDFKEVLSDDSDGHDETDRQGERNRRDNDNNWKEVSPPKAGSVEVLNRNWKGAVLLYPDELSSMMSNPFQTAMPTAKPSTDYWRTTLNMSPSSNNAKELDYLVDFLKNKHEETLTDLAQAYSDYGVLSELTETPRIDSSSNISQPNTSTLIDVNDDENGKFNYDVLDVETKVVQNEYPFKTVSHKNKFKKLNKSPKNRSKRQTGRTTSIEKVNNISNSSELSKKAENNIAKAFNKFTNDMEAIEQSSGIQPTKVQDEDMNPVDFLTLLSSWFGTLASMSESTDNLTAALVKNNPKTKSDSKEIRQSYPVYDSDMVDNIGHRSRVLMSIEEDHTNLADSLSQESTSMQNNALMSESSKTGDTTKLGEKNKTLSDTIIIVTRSINTDKIPDSNDTISKRSVRGDEDFVLWNDMYDDEYGLKMDPLDQNKVLGKKSESVVKKSADWIQNKMKQMTDTIRKRSKDGVNKLNMNIRDNRDTEGSRLKSFLKTNSHQINKRDSDREHVYDRPNFAMMNAHMKEVCKQAAEAVQKTRSIKPREDHESEAARGLMQNVVKLMSDLVDFEVQQRTCLSLPSDLKDFLDWLTNPLPIPAPPHTKNVEIVYSIQPELGDSLIDIATTQSSERENERADARSECLGTLLAVQDLMMDYSKLSDDDKSKMYGVKEYLQDQLEFLNKQIENSDEINHVDNVYSKDLLSARSRRDLLKNPEFQRRRQYRHQNRNKRRFLKNYSKKHTITTPNQFDSLPISSESVKRFTYIQDSVKNIQKVNEEIEDDKKQKKREVEQEKEDNVRSLQDVYFKALKDARKETTPREGKLVNSEGNST